MRKEDCKVGMKVVPFQKTEGVQPLKQSGCYKDLNKFGYLYIIRIDDCFAVLNGDPSNNYGDYFALDDFNPYVEPDTLVNLSEIQNSEIIEVNDVSGHIDDLHPLTFASIQDLTAENTQLKEVTEKMDSEICGLNDEINKLSEQFEKQKVYEDILIEDLKIELERQKSLVVGKDEQITELEHVINYFLRKTNEKNKG